MNIVLASKSQWRRDIAQKALNLNVEKAESGCDEKLIISLNKPKTPEEHVQLISKGKLKACKEARRDKYLKTKEDEIILCYDTIVVCKGQILEKPVDKEDLIREVNLWAKENEVTSIYTGMSIGKLSNDEEDYHEVKRADVLFLRNFTEEEYNSYINDEIVYSSSGSYIIEKLFEMKIAKIIEGSQDIIDGFPIEETKLVINKLMSSNK